MASIGLEMRPRENPSIKSGLDNLIQGNLIGILAQNYEKWLLGGGRRNLVSFKWYHSAASLLSFLVFPSFFPFSPPYSLCECTGGKAATPLELDKSFIRAWATIHVASSSNPVRAVRFIF